jgi:hypothetical protein
MPLTIADTGWVHAIAHAAAGVQSRRSWGRGRRRGLIEKA